MAPSQARPAAAARSITILGATGSIGSSTVDLIKRNPDRYRVEAVSRRGATPRRLPRSRATVGARFAVVADPSAYAELKDALSGTGIEAAAGEEALLEAAQRPADWVMAAISGAVGLKPTLAAIERGATVALANKECLVCAGACSCAPPPRPAPPCCRSIPSTTRFSRRSAPATAPTSSG